MQPIAYFSAEIGFSADVPIYSGGLGILAGDHLKGAADLEIPMVGVTLLYRQGYFKQHLGADGWQTESYPRFVPSPLLERLPRDVSVRLFGRRVHAAVWRTAVVGLSGHRVPILMLDTDVASNAPEDRSITHRLYGGDQELRLLQEIVLGFGGLQAVQDYYPEHAQIHLNEGHTAFAPLALLNRGVDMASVRGRCHFTTHTPVPAGHDVFAYELAQNALGDQLPDNIRELAGHDALSMTELALSLSRSANAVSALHEQVTHRMFPDRTIGHVTNGVHHLSWVSRQMAELFDTHLPDWRHDPDVLKQANALPDAALLAAHRARKQELLTYANSETHRGFAPELLTIGFARRAAAYKRASLLFRDLQRLIEICEGRVQFLFAGKAHPKDEAGHRIIQAVIKASHSLGEKVRVGYVSNYDMWSGALLTSGVDVWLNTPLRPHEASGTSGMKAALNGVPNASILDGWWAEAADDGRNGWVIGSADSCDDEADLASLYETLEKRIIPTYYDAPEAWLGVMKRSIATGARFSATRMLKEYSATYYG